MNKIKFDCLWQAVQSYNDSIRRALSTREFLKSEEIEEIEKKAKRDFIRVIGPELAERRDFS